MSGVELLLIAALAAAVVIFGGLLLGSPRRSQSARTSPSGAAVAHRTVRESSPQVHDDRRTVELRVERHLSALDELILEADREIARLEALLARQQPDLIPFPALSCADQQRCFELWESGLTVEETAEELQTSAAAVQAALDEWRRPASRAA